MITSEPIPDSFFAGVLEGPVRLSVREIPQWNLEEFGDPDLVLIKVSACGVCGSDFRYYAGENPWAQHTLGRFMPNPPNIVLGHEYAGTVIAVQTEANRHLLGKRVAPVCSKTCGACEDCLAGRSRLCAYTVHMGHGQGWGQRDFFPGAYGAYSLAWGASCFAIADDLDFSEAAMMDILAVCLHVAETGGIQIGRPVLCIGAGPAGNGVAQMALAMGASAAVLVDRSLTALEIAERQGIGHRIHIETDLNAAAVQIRHLAPGGFGTVFDTVGSAQSLAFAIEHLGKSGSLVNLAVHDEPIPINFLKLGSERRIVTSCNFEVGDYPRALALLQSGRVSVKEWMTPVTLPELPDWFARIHANPLEKGAFKLVMVPET